jgi:hypothetical protein
LGPADGSGNNTGTNSGNNTGTNSKVRKGQCETRKNFISSRSFEIYPTL